MNAKFRTIILCCAVTIAAGAVIKLWDKITDAFTQLNPLWVGAALIALVIYQVLNAWVWGGVLRAMGSSISAVQGARMWIEAESCRWLPGGIVWGCGSRVLSAPEYGVKKGTVGKGMVVELTVTIAAWATVALFILGTELPGILWSQVTISYSLIPWILSIAVMMVVVTGFALIRWKKWLLTKLHILMEAKQLIFTVAPKVYWKYVALCVGNGVALYLLSFALPDAAGSVFMYVGVGGVAWLCGFFAIGVPSGIGVREAVMVFALSGYIPMEQALVLAVSWRILQILAELAVLGLSLNWKWICNRQHPSVSHV